MLNLRVTPRRMLSDREAAEYRGLPLPEFKRLCPVSAVMLSGDVTRFDMRDLDSWLDGMKAIGADAIVGKLD